MRNFSPSKSKSLTLNKNQIPHTHEAFSLTKKLNQYILKQKLFSSLYMKIPSEARCPLSEPMGFP